jgi:hypothetical protein
MSSLNGWISIHEQLPPANDKNPKMSKIVVWCDMTDPDVEKNRHHSGYFVYGTDKTPAHFQNGGLGLYQFKLNPSTNKHDTPQALFWREHEALPVL